MPYIGNDIQFGELTSQSFTGDNSTTAFTLSYTVANPTSLIVTIDNVIQEPTTAYTVSGTTLTCTSAPAIGDTIHVRYLGRVVDVANAAILQDSDQDTKIQVEESADEDVIRFDVAGAEKLLIAGSTVTINEDGGDVDFRVESDTNANAFHVNSGLFSGVGSVGIGRAADATVDVLVGNQAVTATADASHYRLRVVPAGAVTIPSGTAAEVATLSVFEPNITATGTVTTAASVWVHSAPTEATNNYSLYVDAGVSKFDDAVLAAGGVYLGVTSATAANLLDDYEEGTYTPTVTNATSGSFTVASAYNTLAYTKVGRLVTVTGSIGIDAESSPNGQIRMSLPFTPAALAEGSDAYYNNGCIPYNHADASTNASPVLYLQGSNANVLFYQITHGTGLAGTFDQTDVDGDWGISLMFQYNT